MNVSSLCPWLSNFCTVQFSVSSGCFFVLFCFYILVVLLLVVGGGTVCLPTSPSWPEVYHIFFMQSSINGYLGHLHIFTVVKDAAVNIGMSFQIIVLGYFG